MRRYITKMRKTLKLTQNGLASRMGISRQAVGHIENGTRQTDMDLSTMKKLAAAFDVPLEKIVKEESKYQDERKFKKAN